MDIVMKHFGNAILVGLVLLLLAGILIFALNQDGYVAIAFQNLLNNFFSDMDSLINSANPV